MDSIILEKVKTLIEKEITSCLSKSFHMTQLQHNHPPVRFIVDNCEYCKKHGNILVIS